MINLVTAYANRQVIGKDGKVPWDLPDDMRHFERLTAGQTVVMGTKTFAEVGHPLPGRRNIVLTRSSILSLPGVEIIHSVEEAQDLGDLFVIGGASIYSLFLEIADLLTITEIDLDVDGDTFFPNWNREDFELISQREGLLDARNLFPHRFLVYKRRRS